MLSLGKSDRLPSAYQEIEYIESTGTQFIDTGISDIFSNKIEFEFGFSYKRQASNVEYAVFGSKDSNGQGLTCYFPHSYLMDTLSCWCGSGTSWNVIALTENTKHSGKATFNVGTGRTFIVDNTIYTNASVANNAINNGSIFGLFSDKADTLNSGLIGKIYYWKCKKDGVLVADFVPCYRKSDSEVGMYDLVSGTFFTNQGSGEFLAGVSILSRKQQELYQQVENIESTGTQYIETSIVPSNTKGIYIDFADNDVSNDTVLIGSKATNVNDRFGFGTNLDKFTHYYGTGNNMNDRPSIVAGTRHNAYLKYGVQKFDGNDVTGRNWSDVSSTTFSQPIYIFCGNWNGGANYYSKSKFYCARIDDNGIFILDLVPCYRKSDSEAGLLDVVNDVFYANQGSGSFIMGGGQHLTQSKRKSTKRSSISKA